MASGSFSTPTATSVQNIYPRNMVVEWTSTPNENTNKSVLDWVLKAGDCSYTANYVNFSNVLLTIDGIEVYSDPSQGESAYKANEQIASGSLEIEHEEDGSRIVAVSAEAGIYAWAVNSTYSGTIELDKIQRGMVYIGGEAYQPYIEDGSDWYRYAPNVEDGSAWSLCN